jgi:hypothetical protein
MAGKFEPKTPVVLDPPKNDPISLSTLSTCDGIASEKCYVAIKVNSPPYFSPKAIY